MRTRHRLCAVVLTASALTVAGCASNDPSSPTTTGNSPTPETAGRTMPPRDGTGPSVEGTVLAIRVGERSVHAVMADNATAREFGGLLPVTISMSDMLEREAYGALPAELADDGPRRTEYEVGELVYWPPTSGLAVYYRHAGTPVPEPGLIPLAKITDGVDAFDLSETGQTEVTIQVAD